MVMVGVNLCILPLSTRCVLGTPFYGVTFPRRYRNDEMMISEQVVENA